MNSSFSTTLPTLQTAWDSTSLSALKTCPRLYQYSIVLGYEPRQRSVHLTFGILYHEALETYDHSRSAGVSHDGATCTAVLRALKSTWNKDLSRPWSSGDSCKNRLTLVRTIVWYLDAFAEDPIQTIKLANGKPAVELSFRHSLPYEFRETWEPAILCGHIDRLGDIGGQTWVIDRKTTKHAIDDSFFKRFSPDNQMSAYSFAGRIVYNEPAHGVIIDAAQVLVNGSRFRRGFAHRSPGQLDEWLKDTLYWIGEAERYAVANYWPMNDKSCFNYGGCPFREVCAQSPEYRERYLEMGFSKRVWDPLQVRGDI